MKLKNLRIKSRLRLKKLIINIRQTHLRDLRNVSLSNVKKIPDIVHLKNLVLFSGVLSIVIVAMFVTRFGSLSNYFIKEVPAFGGIYSHGVVGSIEKMNPLFVQDDAESVANKLIYSGLTRTVSGNNVADLAESWTVSTDLTIYNFKLKQNIKWHDGEPFSAEDVVYTIGLIQNPDTRTSLSQVWRGVTVEKISDFEVRFTLPNPFPGFLEVASEPILPKHLLSEIDPKNIKVAEFNTKPVGTGPYMFERFDQIGTQTSVILESNKDFTIHRPFIDQIRLIFFEDNETLYKGLTRRQISGVADISLDRLTDIKKMTNLDITQNYLPQYEVLNFNLKNEILAIKEIRLSFAALLDRKTLINDALDGNAKEISTPILPGRSGYDPKVKGIGYNLTVAIEALDKLGWVKGEDNIRRKEGKILKFRFVYVDNDENDKVALVLEKEFADAGVDLELVPADVHTINASYIRPRNFDMIMIGQNVGIDEDLYSFWHSSQITDPGLNLTGFSDPKVDKLLEQVRKSSDEKYRAERYKQIQEVLLAEQPAIYLYSPLHVSVIGKEIHTAKQKRISQPNDILNNIYDWYIRSRQTR